MSVRIINADVMEGLRQLPDESVHCVVTSPPYWGLRDYGVEGQIGLEASPELFVARMVSVFGEVRRVLRKDGTVWLNLGDSYAGSGKGPSNNSEIDRPYRGMSNIAAAPNRWISVPAGIKQKDLVGIPWRVAFALQADGWWLRSDIIWSKPNPMPESVTDRPTKAHEYVFLLSKSERYYYDDEAVKEPASFLQPNSPQSISSPYGQGFTRRAKGNAKTFRGGVYTGGKSFDNDGDMERDSHGNAPNESLTRNRRSVWTMATAPFAEAHFATFPPELPEICIKAGCPVGGTVLDPFSGAGTTAMVADRLQRNAIGIELNPEYAAMAQRRIDGDRGGLLDIMEAAE
jgi:DNA modification methylase